MSTSSQKKSLIVTLHINPARFQQVLDKVSKPAPPAEVKPKKSLKIKLKASLPSAASVVAPPPAASVKLTTSTPATSSANLLATSASTPLLPPPATSPRPPQLSSLPPIQTQQLPSTASSTAAPTPTPKIRIKPLKRTTEAVPSTPAKTPTIKIKNTASRPSSNRRGVNVGYGYDSEASDREDDPAVEEQIILRMPPGEDAEYLRDAIENRTLNTTSDVWFKFKDDRRAVISVRGKMYAALLVDLPCIIESSKTIDKGKNIFKTADIAQMLLVSDRIVIEDQATSTPLNLSTTNYPHGITPPMQWVRRRRFRKRVYNRNMDKVEEAVEALLAKDSDPACVRSVYTHVNDADNRGNTNGKSRNINTGAGESGDDEMHGNAAEYGDEDAEGEEVDMDMEDGEEDYDDEDGDDDGMDGLDEAAFEDQLAEAMMDIDEPDVISSTARPPHTSTLIPPVNRNAGAGTSGTDSDEDDEDEYEDEGDDLDDDAQEAVRQTAALKEEIADLESAIAAKVKEKENVGNPIVKQRIQNVVDGLRAELELKKGELTGAGK